LVTGFRIKVLEIGIRGACGLVRQNRATNYYQSQAKDQTALRIRLRDLAASRVRYGYRRLHILLRREGWEANGRPINHKRVYRLYKLDGLEIRTKKAKKRISRARVVVPAATAPNERWSMDFVADRLFEYYSFYGRRFRMLTLVDHFRINALAVLVLPLRQIFP
jgi:putative transposase